MDFIANLFDTILCVVLANYQLGLAILTNTGVGMFFVQEEKVRSAIFFQGGFFGKREAYYVPY